MGTVLATTTPHVTPAEVRDRAHRAACSMHANGGPARCEIGAVVSAAVLDDLAVWLRDPTSGAAHTVQDALREDATTNPWGSPVTRAQAVCDALAERLDGGGSPCLTQW